MREPISVYADPLLALYTVSLLSGLTLGLFNPLASAYLLERDASEMAIGTNATLFFLGVTLATPVASGLIARIGNRWTMAIGMSLTSTAALMFPMGELLPSPASVADRLAGLLPWLKALGWLDFLREINGEASRRFVLRAVMGLGVGLYMVGGQTALNTAAPLERRALVSGLHALMFGIGLGLGPLLGSWLYQLGPELAFGVGAAIIFAGIPIVGVGLYDSGPVRAATCAGVLSRIRLPLHGAFAYGFAEATLVSMFPVYVLTRGFTVVQMGVAFSAFVIGGILGTLPTAHWGDRYGRERILCGCVAIGVAALTVLALEVSYEVLMAVAFLAGASLGPVFALSLALVGEALPRHDLATGSAWFTAAFSLGCTAAPASSALIMATAGDRHLFTLTIALFGVFLIRLLIDPRVWKGSHLGQERPGAQPARQGER